MAAAMAAEVATAAWAAAGVVAAGVASGEGAGWEGTSVGRAGMGGWMVGGVQRAAGLLWRPILQRLRAPK